MTISLTAFGRISTALLALLWNRSLVLGLVINALLIAGAVLRPAGQEVSEPASMGS